MKRRLLQGAIGAVVIVALVAAGLFFFSPASPIHAQTVTYGTAVVNTSFLNVRAGPGSQFLVMGVVKGGTELSVTGVSADGDWWRVNTPFGEGFVFADYIVYRGAAASVPIVRTSDVSAPETTTVVVLASALNVRAGPSLNDTVLGVVPQSFVMSVIGQDTETGWYNVISPFGPGWVANEEVALTGAPSSVPTAGSGGGAALGISAAGSGTVADEQFRFVPTGFATTGVVQFASLGLRSRPIYGSTILGRVAAGDTLTVTGRNGDGSFMLVDSPFGPAWAPQDGIRLSGIEVFDLPEVDLNPQLSIEGKPSVANGTNISSGSGLPGHTTHEDVIVHVRPQLEAPAMGSLGAAVTGTAIGRDHDLQFYQIPTPFGVGWVRVDQDFRVEKGNDPYLLPITAANGIPFGDTTTTGTASSGTTSGVVSSGTTSTGAGPVVIVNTPNLNLRSGAGAQFSVITVVTGGSQYTVTGQLSDGSWYRVSTPFGEGWLFADYVVFRGDSSGVPIVSS